MIKKTKNISQYGYYKYEMRHGILEYNNCFYLCKVSKSFFHKI